MRRSGFVAGVIGLVTLLATFAPATSAAAADRSDLPPASRQELIALFERKVGKLGLRVTRAALVNPQQERDPDGTHLAIYVEPTGEYTPQDYINGAVDVTRVFLPSVFARWKALKSFDVCQEPRPSVDNSTTPAPETQVFATRAGSKLVDWSTVDVGSMIRESDAEATAAGTKRPVRFSLYVTQHLQNTPAYQAVANTTTAPSTTTPAARGYG